MEDNDWVNFWRQYGMKTKGADKQTQVLRTINKQPVNNESWESCLLYIKEQVELCKEDDVLDLCCGNGLIAEYLAPHCASLTAVDVSDDLLQGISIAKYPNIKPICKDIRELEFPDATFSKVIIYAGIQYLSLREAVFLLEKVRKWLKPGGIFFIGDIPDTGKRWTFFNSNERERVYFNTVKENKDIVGTWFSREWLTRLSGFAGFSSFEVLEQSAEMLCHYYRFDMKIKA